MLPSESLWQIPRDIALSAVLGNKPLGLAALRNMDYIHVTHELSETLGYF